MLCGTDHIPQNITHICTKCGQYSGIFYGNLLVPLNIVMDLNNTMNMRA